MSFMSKYVFIENKLDIQNIYTQEEFDEKYEDILPYLNQIVKNIGSDHYNIYMNYNITLIIIDILFKKALLI